MCEEYHEKEGGGGISSTPTYEKISESCHFNGPHLGNIHNIALKYKPCKVVIKKRTI